MQQLLDAVLWLGHSGGGGGGGGGGAGGRTVESPPPSSKADDDDDGDEAEEAEGAYEATPLRTHPHFDMTDNLYRILSGKKRFSLVSPRHACNYSTVVPVVFVSRSGHCATSAGDSEYNDPRHRGHFLRLDDMLGFDAERYPRFAGVPVSTFTLDAGELLYHPATAICLSSPLVLSSAIGRPGVVLPYDSEDDRYGP
eukprot:COSAG05_NODE_3834_length_1814_cov_5.913120_2_plen_197_part_00